MVAYAFLLYSMGPIRSFWSRGENREKFLQGQRQLQLLKVGGVYEGFFFSWIFLTANSRFCGCTTADSHI